MDSGLLSAGALGPSGSLALASCMSLLPAWKGALLEPTDAGPTRGLGPLWLEAAPGGRGLHWDICLAGLQPLRHRDPAQQHMCLELICGN